MIEPFKTSPVVFPTVSYESVRCRQRQGAKPLGQCSLYCEHQRGQELGVSGTVNESELLINVVNASKPKRLRGLNQKVSGQAQGLQRPLSETIAPPAERPHLTDSGTQAQRGRARTAPVEGKHAARRADRCAGMG